MFYLGFVGKKELRDHTVNVHTKTRPYPCRYGCDIGKTRPNPHRICI